MYFPTSTARKLSSDSGLPHRNSPRIICLSPSPKRSLFCTLAANSVSVWRVRPSTVLAHITRTPLSIQDHGENEAAHWSPDGSSIILGTTNSHLILIRVHYSLIPAPYQFPTDSPSFQQQFLPGAGEAIPLQRIHLTLEGVVRLEGGLQCISPRASFVLYGTRHPNAVQRMAWPVGSSERLLTEETQQHPFIGHETWDIGHTDFPWLINTEVALSSISYCEQDEAEVWITSDGSAYFIRLDERQIEVPTTRALWQGICISSPTMRENADGVSRQAKQCALNMTFSLVALGMDDGNIEVVNYPNPDRPNTLCHIFKPPDISFRPHRGQVKAMEWTSDGCVLTVGWDHGWALWSAGGRSLIWSFADGQQSHNPHFRDLYLNGVQGLFWGPENIDLVALTSYLPGCDDDQLYVIPFAKSAVVGQQSPDNTQYAVLQLDDRVMVYRGADQPDMSIINPESDVWQSISIPSIYIASNWPIKYTAISNDGRLIAVAGRRGFVHYSFTSGRWKGFVERSQEQTFVVTGGMVWFHHVLIAAIEVAGSSQLRLYSRDLDLTAPNILFRELLSSPVVLLSLVDNSLLVYTTDNVLLHYLIVPTDKTIKLHLCGSITFEGVIAFPRTVRCLSWMIPNAQKQFGDPTEDLSVATVLMLVGGRLVLLRPRKSGSQEVKYDMQILADRIEFCWIHLRGIGTLENSLWGYDGRSIRVWLDALTIEGMSVNPKDDGYESVQESVIFALDFYPLSALLDKGIILGVDAEQVIRPSMPFAQFRIVTSTHLFLQHMLRFHLEQCKVDQAVQFASHYQTLVFFAHALEVLLHTVLETEVDNESIHGHHEDDILRATIDFLDHFDQSLDVVVGCARKTEMYRWRRLFNVVGNPKSLFEICLTRGRLKTAASYLLILHNLEQLHDGNADAIRLLKKSIESKDWQLCQELLRFVKSIDVSGEALERVLEEAHLLSTSHSPDVVISDL